MRERGRVTGSFLLTLLAIVLLACGSEGPIGNVGGSAGTNVDLAAVNLAFDRSSLQFHTGVVVALTFENRDPGILHNVAIYRAADRDPVFRGETFTGIATRTFLLGPLAVGSYRFVCDVHPTMSGTVTVDPE